MSFEVRIDGQLSVRGADGREVRGDGTVVLAAAEASIHRSVGFEVVRVSA